MRTAVLAAVLALAACGGDEESHPCTTKGCFHGLLVTVANPPAEAYRVEATATGQTTPQVMECDHGGSCFVLFGSFFPDQVTIRVVLSASGTVARSATVFPSYNVQQPNGPGCNTCLNATVAL